MSDESKKLNDEENKRLLEEESAQWMKFAQKDYDLVQHLYHGDYHPKPLEIKQWNTQNHFCLD